jgi:hypothetical protein
VLRHLVVLMPKAETGASPMLRRIQKEESRKTVVGAPEGQVGNFA